MMFVLEFPLLFAALFAWMPFPLGLFAGGVFVVLSLVFVVKFVAFVKKVLPF